MFTRYLGQIAGKERPSRETRSRRSGRKYLIGSLKLGKNDEDFGEGRAGALETSEVKLPSPLPKKNKDLQSDDAGHKYARLQINHLQCFHLFRDYFNSYVLILEKYEFPSTISNMVSTNQNVRSISAVL